ncbi:MAG: PEP-CTERM sorting domain-containing protein [Chthoniobacterales bacterium]
MKTNTLTLLNRVDARLAACAAVALAGTAITVTPAQADIVYSGPVNILIPVTTSGVYLNVVTGVFAPTPGGAPGWDVNPYGSSNLTLFNPSTPSGGVYQGSANNFNLAMGTLVGPGGPFSSGVFGPLNLNSSNNYVGFRLTNESTGAINYGWFQISLGASATDPARAIVGYAFENTGATINVGQVPEPNTFALLGLVAVGGAGIRAWRKRKVA